MFFLHIPFKRTNFFSFHLSFFKNTYHSSALLLKIISLYSGFVHLMCAFVAVCWFFMSFCVTRCIFFLLQQHTIKWQLQAIIICDMMTSTEKYLRKLTWSLALLLLPRTTHGGRDGIILEGWLFLLLSPFVLTGACVMAVEIW